MGVYVERSMGGAVLGGTTLMQTTITLQPGDSVTIIAAADPVIGPPPPVITPPPIAAPTLPSLPLTDFSRFLVERVLPDGSFAFSPTAGAKRTVYDALSWVRRDYGIAGGYEAYVAAEDGPNARWVGAWSFYPFAGFNPTLGDGGQTIQEDGNLLCIMATQDGGRPDIQKFTGIGQGGTGWIICDDRPPTGSWASTVALLNIDGALPLNAAFTRWRMELLPIPFTINGARQDITLPCIVTEHYNGMTLQGAVSMEQSIYADTVGEVFWAAYDATDPASDLSVRLPYGLPWPAPPERHLNLVDARLWTNMEEVAAGDQNKVAWPPRRETMISTMMVLLLAAITAVFFISVDLGVGSAVHWILGMGV